MITATRIYENFSRWMLVDRLEIANNIAKQKDVENCTQIWGKQDLSFLIDHVS